jgi:hypothetical protein
MIGSIIIFQIKEYICINMGIGDWGLGIGGWGPNPQTQNPKPQTQNPKI